VELYSHPEIVPQVVGQLLNAENQRLESKTQIVQQLVAQLPWGHNVVIIDKCKTIEEALFYIQETLAHNWSRAVLIHQIETKLHLRKANAINNFQHTLDKIQADLARETLKNPYNFDFLTIGVEAKERDLENALIAHIQRFLLELGQGFAFMGRQYPLRVGNEDFRLDLLFYHIRLRCFVVVDLKITSFKPEFAGKLNFYLNVVDDKLKHASDQPSIGILLCKTPDKVVVEYSLKNINSPLGISEYTLVNSIPENLKGELPDIEELEDELNNSIHDTNLLP
jgi:predicted nuclease of restriction endonuclease-like (RecB) superfamily